MSMLKCGQKDNKNYTFGVRKEQVKKESKISEILCFNCNACLTKDMEFCPVCGTKK